MGTISVFVCERPAHLISSNYLCHLASSQTLYPPSHQCQNADCNRNSRGLRLQKAEQHQGVLYTLNDGSLPVWVIRLYCQGVSACYDTFAMHSHSQIPCKIDYHLNYYVRAGQRTYYDSMPEVIQVGKPRFIECRVVELWRTDMLLAWKSATNCARTYQFALSKVQEPPADWKIGFTLKPEHVYDAFTILSLLDDHQARGETLVVPHTGNQQDRFKTAMQARSIRIRLYHQPEINHYCAKCIRTYKGPDGQG